MTPIQELFPDPGKKLQQVLAANARKVPTVEELAKLAYHNFCSAPDTITPEALWDANKCPSAWTEAARVIHDAILGTAPPPEPKMPVEQEGFETFWQDYRKHDFGSHDAAQKAWHVSARQSQAKVDELEKEIQRIRPLADCYERVCQSLGVESDILGSVRGMKDELAQLRWRDVKGPPPDESLVVATDGKEWRVLRAPIGMGWTHWMPAPPLPDAFTLWHAKHGGTREMFDDARK